MSVELPAGDEIDLESLYAQANLHDLLSREQEQVIDGRKWGAVRSLVEVLCEDGFCRNYLERWVVNCTEPLPRMEKFECREHGTLLRRELGDYLPGGKHNPTISALAEQLSGDDRDGLRPRDLLGLSLPATLVVGFAEVLSQQCGEADGSKVGAALDSLLLPRSEAMRGATDPEASRRFVLGGGDDYELLFTLPPLLSIRRVKPALIFRREMAEVRPPLAVRFKRQIPSILCGALILLGLVVASRFSFRRGRGARRRPRRTRGGFAPSDVSRSRVGRTPGRLGCVGQRRAAGPARLGRMGPKPRAGRIGRNPPGTAGRPGLPGRSARAATEPPTIMSPVPPK